MYNIQPEELPPMIENPKTSIYMAKVNFENQGDYIVYTYSDIMCGFWKHHIRDKLLSTGIPKSVEFIYLIGKETIYFTEPTSIDAFITYFSVLTKLKFDAKNT